MAPNLRATANPTKAPTPSPTKAPQMGGNMGDNMGDMGDHGDMGDMSDIEDNMGDMTVGCTNGGNYPFFCTEEAANQQSSVGTSHEMMGYFMPDGFPMMIMDGSYTGDAAECDCSTLAPTPT